MVRYRYRTTGEVFDDGQIRNFFNAQACVRGLWSPNACAA